MITPTNTEVAQKLFAGYASRDVDAVLECWAPGGIEKSALAGERKAPEELRDFFLEFYGAFPDAVSEIVDIIADGPKVVVVHRMHGSFSGTNFQGLRASGKYWELEAVDIFHIEGGLIHRADVFMDNMEVARQIGLLPPANGRAEQVMKGAFNLAMWARTKVGSHRGSA
jgi:steroid delta-isomerase-like uncharacterized protein